MRELQPAELDALRKTAEGKLRTPKSKELRRRPPRRIMDAAGLPTVAPRPTIHPRPTQPFAAKPFEARPAATGNSRPSKFFARDKSTPFRPAGEGFRPASDRPAWKKPAASERPANKRPFAPRRQVPVRDKNFSPVRPPNLHIEEIQQSEPSNAARPSAPRSSSIRPSSGRPFQRGLPRAFTTSSGKPRAGGARPSSKPGKSSVRSYGSDSSARPASGSRTGGTRTDSSYRPSPGEKRPFDGPSSGFGSRPARPYTPRPEGASGSRFPNTRKFAGSSSSHGTGPRSENPRHEGSSGERKAGAGWKPKTRYGGPNKPASGARSKPRPGSSTRPAFKSKPGGKRPGGAFGGKKRG